MTDLIKWVDLKDATTKGKLKVMEMKDGNGQQLNYLFIIGLENTTDRWKRAKELLGFQESPRRKYLFKAIMPGDRINAEMFRSVWPNAAIVHMPRDDARLDMKSSTRKQIENGPVLEEKRDLSREFGEVIRLGRNADGDLVFKSPLGRLIERRGGNVVEGAALLSPALFLRATNVDEEMICADGFVQAMLMGEAQQTNDFNAFVSAMTDFPGPFSPERINTACSAIESAVLRYLSTAHQTPQDAYGDSARLYEFLPPYQGEPRGAGAMPIPLSVMAQRLLGDTSGKTVLYPDAYDGASFAFLPAGTHIQAFRGSRDISVYARSANVVDVQWSDVFEASNASMADAMFINKDPSADGQREDYSQTIRALRSLKPDGRAVIVLAAGEHDRSGEIGRESRNFYDLLSRGYQLEAAFEIPAQLTNRSGTNRALRVVAIKNRRPGRVEYIREFPQMNSWDDCKTFVDEAIVKINLKEAEGDSIDVDHVTQENEFQRPYIAFSKTADATTMIPKNLQAPMQGALSALEYLEGEIDHFVESQLQFGENTLGDRFSPEQVDAIALSIHRLGQGRAPIIGDETGIGKGRTLSALAVWANKQGKAVIFITDKANLFSDLARDLRHIEEWGRFSPLVTNAGAVLLDDVTKEIVHPGTPAAEMKNIVENMVPLEMTPYNMVFTTYSQIATEDSIKSEWLLEQVSNALLIVDESHVAAGSDSNMSRAVMDLANRSWGTVYSSATWAKSSENLHIYSRAFPEAINISTLTTTMRSGGEVFSEVFSSMLAKDGAFIRREHDLSKLEIVIEVDKENLQRNGEIADKVAEVLGAMTYVGGEINRLLMRSNNDTIAALRRAREAHSTVAEHLREAAAVRRTAANRRLAEQTATDAPAQTATSSQPISLFKSRFGAGTVLYQVMRRVLAVLNVDNTARLAIQARDEGRKPVIVFEDTGETFLRRIINEMTIPAMPGESAIAPEFIPVPTIRDLLRQVVARMGVVQRRIVTDSQILNGNPEALVIDDAEGIDVDAELAGGAGVSIGEFEFSLENLPGLSEDKKDEYLEGIKRILELIDQLPPLPLNAIDVLRARLQDAGMSVGEISGRRIYLEMPEAIRNAPIDGDWDKSGHSQWRVAYRNKNKRSVSETTSGFNNGDLDALVINRSAATGISLHASPRFQDTRRRELIEMQIPANPTERIQLFGRVNRYDQVVGPRISMASTGIYGEVRQLMMSNKKVARLSANTRSSRENALENKLVTDLLNTVGEDVCERFLHENAPIRQRLGITDSELESPNFSAAEKLTSRLVLLRMKEQQMVYEEIYAAYDEEIIRLDLAGKNPLKSREMDIRANVIQSRIAIGVEMDGVGSAFDGPVYMREIAWTQELRPMGWTDVKEKIRASRQSLLKSNLARLPSLEPVALSSLSNTDEVLVEDTEIAESQDGNQLNFLTFEELTSGTVPSLRIEQHVDSGQSDAIPEDSPFHAEQTLLAKSMGLHDFVSHPQGTASTALEAMSSFAVNLDSESIGSATMAYRQSQEIYSSLNLSRPVQMLAQILGDRARLALSGTTYIDVESALRSDRKNSVRDMWAKKVWVERHFGNLQPGSMIGIQPYSAQKIRNRGSNAQYENLFREKLIITALVPPPEGKEAQLSKWKIEGLVPGDENVRQFSLNKLLEDVSLMYLLRSETVNSLELTGGPVMHGFAFAGYNLASDHCEYKTIRNRFETAEVGQRNRKAFVLEGNMYLASEWAQATGKGHGVVYTDEAGARHRAVMLTQSSLFGDRDLFSHLPIRLWVPSMINRFVAKLWEQVHLAENERIPFNLANTAPGYILKTDFASAMTDSATARENSSQVVIIPGQMVGITLDRKEMTRISRAVRSESKRSFALKHPHHKMYSPERKEAAQADLIQVRTTSKRGQQSMVLIDTPTIEKSEEAINLIMSSVGMEIYLWPNSRIGLAGKEVVESYFSQRRDDALSLREQARIRRESSRPVVQAPMLAARSDSETEESTQNEQQSMAG